MENPKYTIAAFFSPSEIATCVRLLELIGPPNTDWHDLGNLTSRQVWKGVVPWDNSLQKK